jgi:hypothetical protein
MTSCSPLLVLATLALSLAASSVAHAQLMTRPHLAWRTVETENFIVHYPVELERWTLEVTERLESVHEAVSALVGASPQRRVTVIVEDPQNQSNGFAFPDRNSPLIFLFPTPPTPQTIIGSHRGWGELLAVHEFAHIAHLTRPSRNPTQRLLWSLSPVQLGPIALRAPRWVTEGFATYVEGRLTGSGRPHGVWRPAVLRQWALEGQLPRYGQLDDTEGFFGGAMAYLAGSAFLEWLVEQRGEESLQHLWRRMTARVDRGFVEAFAGVYGAPPDELYGRFTVELTGHALAVESALDAEEVEAGEQVQRLSMRTGDPAVSPDGRHLAIVLRQRDRPSRIVVWRTEPQPETEAQRRQRERVLERDPEDVPAVEWRPRPRRALATLHPSAGRSHDSPRFMPDGRHILVTRPEATSDGTIRPDLYSWNWETGALRRITRGAAIRHADPSPDGRMAIADRCLFGLCDIVAVDLRTGGVRTVLEGSPTTPYYRPRFSRDGRRVVAGMQSAGQWVVGLVDVERGTFSRIGPDDDADRFDPAFMPDGESVVVVSELGGVANLELIELSSGHARPLTRVTSGVIAPAPNPATGDIFFLHLQARGLDLRRVHPESVTVTTIVQLDPAGSPAAPVAPAAPADTFTVRPVSAPRSYGFGPRSHRVFPGMVLSPEGNALTAALASTDPAGRLTWLLQGSAGARSLWRGGALGGNWRGIRPWVGGELFLAGQRPSAQQRGGIGLEALDVDYGGGSLWAELPIDRIAHGGRIRGGVSLGRLEDPEGDATRRLAFLDLSGRLLQSFGEWTLTTNLGVHGSTGETGEQSWVRGVGVAEAGVSRRGNGVWVQLMHGRVGDDAPAFEQFAVGGNRATLFDQALLSQRISLPALPLGVTGGSEVTSLRFALDPEGGFYYWMGRSETIGRWHRVWGVEGEVRLPPIAFAGLPSLSVRSGIAYSVDEPFRRRLTSHLALIYRP